MGAAPARSTKSAKRAGLVLLVLMAAAPRAGAAVQTATAPALDRRAQQQTVDGIAAVVNGEVVSIAEVVRAALLLRLHRDGRPATGCGGLGTEAVTSGDEQTAELRSEPDTDELKAALECLIDGALAFREARRFPQLDVTREQVDDAYRRLESSFTDDAAFAAALERFGLTTDGLRRDLRRQLLVAAYVDSRFRATVDIDEETARAYYREQLIPDMRARGIEPPPYEEVAEDYVLPILQEREVNRRVVSWLEDLRARATIRRLYPASIR